ncbi:MAG TPA: hypothetical protein VJI74_03690 [Candidatus Paceibacterota bacterium]
MTSPRTAGFCTYCGKISPIPCSKINLENIDPLLATMVEECRRRETLEAPLLEGRVVPDNDNAVMPPVPRPPT